MNEIINAPDFLIIGSMKSGTTVLYENICIHDQVGQSKVKEVHYFSLYPYKGIDWYLNHFSKEGQQIVGEASPTYFDIATTRAIPESIKTLNPDTKLLLIVRDPVERAISHFSHLRVINQIEQIIEMDINDFFARPFEDAIKQMTMIDFFLNQVLSFSCYCRKFSTYLNVFDREQILVLRNRDLKEDPQGTMKRVFEHLDLDPIQSDVFEKFKYSTGTNVGNLSQNNVNKLKEFLYPDYKEFCKMANIEYSPVFGK